jgi:hypothetical protein
MTAVCPNASEIDGIFAFPLELDEGREAFEALHVFDATGQFKSKTHTCRINGL